jgi:hypothetical protein
MAARDEALALAAVDAAGLYVRQVWITQLTAALESQAVLSGLADELRRRGADATSVFDLIRDTRASITTPQDPAPGRALLDALVTDARALLELSK